MTVNNYSAQKSPYITLIDYLGLIESLAADLHYDGHIQLITNSDGTKYRTPSINPSWYKDNAFLVKSTRSDNFLSRSPTTNRIKLAVHKVKVGELLSKSDLRILFALLEVALDLIDENSSESIAE